MARPRPHFRVHVSISNHRNTAVMWRDPMNRGIYCELGRLFIEKYGAKSGDSVNFSAGDMMLITGCSTPSSASKRWQSFVSHCRVGAESLGGHSPVTSESLGSHYRVTFRNFAKKHNMRQENEQERAPKKEERREKKEEKRKKSMSGGKPPPPRHAVDAAKLLHEKLTARMPGVAGSWTLTKERNWALEIAKIEASPDEIRAAIEFLFGPVNEGQYRVEVQSGRSLHAKWGKALAAMQRAKSPKVTPVKTGGMGVWQNG